MDNISPLKDCFGCSVCSSICPTKAISMSCNADGFVSPMVDDSKCIECGLCLNTCSFVNRDITTDTFNYFAGWSNDPDIRQSSSSGGIAYELAKTALADDFQIYLAFYDAKDRCVRYYTSSATESFDKSQGSKYIQSIDFPSVDFKRKNLVVGTPCAIASLRNVIKKRKVDDNFILVDFFCHGVPSYLLWEKYLRLVEEETGTSSFAVWRDKETGWHDSWHMKITGENGTYCRRFSKDDLFYLFFLKNRCLRPSCYDSCYFKANSSAADIRIGDCWGSKYADDELGVNGIVTFTNRGYDFLMSLQQTCTILPSTEQIVLESQMRVCAKRPPSYKYVRSALKNPKSNLRSINHLANTLDFIFGRIPFFIKYYPRRAFQKLFHQ